MTWRSEPRRKVRWFLVNGEAAVRIEPDSLSGGHGRRFRPVLRVVRPHKDIAVLFSYVLIEFDRDPAVSRRIKCINNRPAAIRGVLRWQVERIALAPSVEARGAG